MASRTPDQVLHDHLRLRRAHDIETDLAGNVADDVVLLCMNGALRDHVVGGADLYVIEQGKIRMQSIHDALVGPDAA